MGLHTIFVRLHNRLIILKIIF